MKKLVVGVWKDRLSLLESMKAANELAELCRDLNTRGFTAAVAPAPYAAQAACEQFRGTPISVVFQDVHWPAPQGSYIGSTPIRVLFDLGIDTVMVGHSERRRFFGETNEDINRKLAGIIDVKLHPILCVGDDVEDWTKRREILRDQLRGALRPSSGVDIDIRGISIAYEPVWAISTWRSDRPLPSGEEVAKMLDLVRDVTREVTQDAVADTRILFGGSVGPTNADEYFGTPGVDGALVGGASLKPISMAAVFESAAKAWNR